MSKEFYNLTDDWVQNLEASYDRIKQELLAVADIDASPYISANWTPTHPHYTKGPEERQLHWKTYEFTFFGIEHPVHHEACPETSKLIRQIPELITAQFSLLYPNTHIQPHTGYSRMILRNHLPLVVPAQGDMGIRVGSETRAWEEGKLMSFYDFLDHEAWNNSNEIRAVLMFDTPHPEWDYSAEQISRYKIENLDDPYLLNIGSKEMWMSWFEERKFPISV